MYREIIILLLVGSLAGFLNGGLGIGGGLIIVPGLVIFLKYSQHLAQGTSIALMLPPIFIAAAYNFYKAGFVDLKVAGLLIITFLFGAYFGAKASLKMSEITAKKIFGILTIVAGLKMLFD